MLELLTRDLPTDHFSIHAEILQDSADAGGEVGLFCALREYPWGPMPWSLSFVSLSTTSKTCARDRTTAEKSAGASSRSPGTRLIWAGVGCLPRPQVTNAPCGIPLSAASRRAIFRPRTAGAPRWRRLTLEVSPDGVRGSWANRTSARTRLKRSPHIRGKA